jgi:hypothetical protein
MSVPILAAISVLFVLAGVFFMYKIIAFTPAIPETTGVGMTRSIANIIKNTQRI